jgi:starvation-inducible DNA-binding protein
MSSPVSKILTSVLADTYALAVKTHGAHWNVVGSGFFQLHQAFGAQYEALFDAADDLAERLRALGGSAPAGISALAKLAGIGDLGDDHEGRALAKALRDDHRTLSKACAKALAVAEKAGDEATVDMLVGRIEEHDKTAWMLDAYSSGK